MATYNQAEIAKAIAQEILSESEEVNGIGIAVLGGGEWGVKVNLTGPTNVLLPATINSVPVTYEVVGPITAAG